MERWLEWNISITMISTKVGKGAYKGGDGRTSSHPPTKNLLLKWVM